MIRVSAEWCKVVRAVIDNRYWCTSTEISKASKVVNRTVRHHLTKLVKENVLEERRLFPAIKYQLRFSLNSKAGKALVAQLEEAEGLF